MNNPHTVTGMWRHVLSIYHHMTQNDKDLQKTAQNTVESLDMNLWIVFIAFCCCCWSLLPLLILVCNWHLSVITRRKYNVVSYNNESNWRRRVVKGQRSDRATLFMRSLLSACVKAARRLMFVDTLRCHRLLMIRPPLSSWSASVYEPNFKVTSSLCAVAQGSIKATSIALHFGL